MPDGLWAVTCLFNPAGYRRRLTNYRVFRERLNVPLVTVELSFTGEFELRPGDAEVLVQFRGGDRLWQKERLLNVAVARLPAECRHVAWLDCDIVFGSADWAEAASAALEEVPLCQLFSTVHHLAPDPPGFTAQHCVDWQKGFMYGYEQGSCVHPPPGQQALYRHGYGWAARRALLEGHGLYDRCVVGGGDKFIAAAATGSWEQILSTRPFSAAHAEDYRSWAAGFHSALCGASPGYLDRDVFHLWHGDLRDRGYEFRHAILAEHGYDPRTDLALDGQGCWRWSSPKHEMHRRVREFFHDRNEDGPFPGRPD